MPPAMTVKSTTPVTRHPYFDDLGGKRGQGRQGQRRGGDELVPRMSLVGRYRQLCGGAWPAVVRAMAPMGDAPAAAQKQTAAIPMNSASFT